MTSFNSGGINIPAELHEGTGGAGRGLVVIAYGVDGLVDNDRGPWATMIRGYAEALADAAFVAIIPHYLAKTGTSPGLAVIDTIILHRDRWCATIGDAVAHTAALPGVDPARIGLLGFSLGGNLCLQLRQTAKVLVSYFAPRDFLAPSPPGGALYVQIHHGEADPLVPFHPNAGDIKGLLHGEGRNVELFAYPGANHGFVGDGANETARQLSLQRTVEFFKQHL